MPHHHQLHEIISTDRVKRTYALGTGIAKEVALDYDQRFGVGQIGPVLSPTEQDDYFLDMGGMLCVGAPTATVQHDGFRLGFWCEQQDLVEGRLKKAMSEPRGRMGAYTYCKIHGKYSCICIPFDLAKGLLECVQEVRDSCNDSWDSFYRDFLGKMRVKP